MSPDWLRPALAAGPTRLDEGAGAVAALDLWPAGPGGVVISLEGEGQGTWALALWWSPGAGGPRFDAPVALGALRAAFAPGGAAVALPGPDGQVLRWALPSGQALPPLRVAAGAQALAFHPGGRLLAAGTADGLIRLWDLEAGRAAADLDGGDGQVVDLAFSPDGALLAATVEGWGVQLWDPARGERVAEDRLPGVVYRLAFSADGRRVAAGTDAGEVLVYAPAERARVLRLRGHAAEVEGLAYDPAGRALASASLDGTVRLWGPDGAALATLDAGAPTAAVQWTAEGLTAATGAGDLLRWAL